VNDRFLRVVLVPDGTLCTITVEHAGNRLGIEQVTLEGIKELGVTAVPGAKLLST
jgi:hypothetical protein